MSSVSAATAEDDNITVVLNENLDAFTEGSVDSPGTVDIASFLSGKLSKLLPDWKGTKVYEAGGCLKMTGGGSYSSYLQTPRLDLKTGNSNGIVRISFRAKAVADYGDMISCEVGSSLNKVSFMPEDGEWHTFSFISEKGSVSTTIKFYSLLEGFFIDDIKVEYSPSFIKAPEAQRPSDADGESFTASWTASYTATNYILDVYTKNAEGDKIPFLNEEFGSLVRSKKVTGLSPEETYYYTVRAKNETAISEYSNEVQVVEVIKSLDAPVVSAATSVTENGFTANWNAVNKATSYTVVLSKKETLTQDKEAVILTEDFSGITQGTLTNVHFGNKLNEYLDQYTVLPGWFASYHCFASGYLGLAPFGSSAYLLSPQIDLSKNDGAFTLRVDMAFIDKNDSVTVNLYNGENIVETQKLKNIPEQSSKTYTLKFTKGSAESYIEIFYKGSQKAFVDKFTVLQTLKAGDEIVSVVKMEETSGTSYDFAVDMSGVKYAYRVKANAVTIDDQGEEITVSSVLSDEVEVSYTSGTAEILSQANIYKSGDHIVVNLAHPEKIAVYSVDGRLVYYGEGIAGENILSVNSSSVVIVKAGDKVAKIKL